MSNIHPGSPRDDADESPFTVEDAGSTTDAGDLVGGERARQGDAALTDDGAVAAADADRTGGAEYSTGSSAGAHAATSADTAPSSTATSRDDAAPGSGRDSDTGLGLSALDDGSIGHVFDQTNGVVEGLEGDSDGTAESDELSREERRDENPDLFHDAEVRGSGRTDAPTGS